ncbi:hypothetical protein D3C75_675460 [compost metagenome]
MSLHIGYFAGAGLPVSAIGIAAGGIRRLPAVVHNNRLAAQLRCQSAFRFHRLRCQLLVKAVPGGIHRLPGRVRYRGRHMAGEAGPPVRYACQYLIVRNAAGIQPQPGFIGRQRRTRYSEQCHRAVKAGRLFVQTRMQLQRVHDIRAGKAQHIVAPVAV